MRTIPPGMSIEGVDGIKGKDGWTLLGACWLDSMPRNHKKD